MASKTTSLLKKEEKIYLFKDDSRYISNIIDIDEKNNEVLITIPLYKMKKMFLYKNKSYLAEVISNMHGIVLFECVLSDYKQDSILIKILKMKKQKQRRECFRLKTIKKFEVFREFDFEKIQKLKKSNLEKLKEMETLTIDLSLSGIAFVSEEKLKIDDIKIIKLNLTGKPIWIKVLVKNCKTIDKGKFRIGCFFEEIEKEDKKIINKYIIDEQIKYMSTMKDFKV